MRPLFTGSSLERARLCPASHALPQSKTTSPQAERGKAIHLYLSGLAKTGRIDEALIGVPEEFHAVCRGIDIKSLPQIDTRGYAAEVSFAFDVETGKARELGRNLDRNYGTLGPNEVPLTVDSVALVTDGESVGVWDYKSGQRVTHASRNPQLLIGALAAARAYGRARAEVGLIYIGENGASYTQRATFEEWTLDAFGAELRTIAAAVRHARDLVAAGFIPDTYSGDHCHYCGAYVHCPATTSLAHALATEAQDVRRDIETALTPDMARLAYTKWRRAHELIARAGEALRAYAAEYPIEVADGTFYGPVTSKRDQVDGPKARKVLLEMYGQAAADAACEFETSKAAIQRALKPVAEANGVPLARLEREVLKAIADAGGIDKRVSVVWREYTQRKELPSDDH